MDPVARFQAPRGTRDILPPESGRQTALVSRFANLAGRAGFGQIMSPIFEEVGVFARIGEATDVVSKEMYDFFDRDDPPRHLALRPELTASVVRAFVQHRPVTPWKVWYEGPQFRYEKPQAGRYRQFTQVGVEALGTDDAHIDVEVIALAWAFYRDLGLRQVDLHVNSLGDPTCRPAYLAALAAYLEKRSGELTEQSRATLAVNPLRVLDSKRAPDQSIIDDAPRMVDHLSPECRDHFERVRAGLDALGIPYSISPRLVRGLDYYTKTTFEFASVALESAQNAVGGGGRYDRLAEDLGGPPTPGIGFALGVERILLACDAEGAFVAPSLAPDVFVIDVTGGLEAVRLTHELRDAGLRADRAFDARSMKAQMKAADRSDAVVAVIVGDDELAAGTVTLRDLRGDRGQHAVSRADVVSAARRLLSEGQP